MFTDYTEFGPTLLGDASRKLNAKFRLTNVNTTIANTLRRAILTLTPSVGFRTEPYEKSEVVISVNTTPLVNEMIAHRVGMIPIKADPRTFKPELYEFVLDMRNDTKDLMDVRAGDIQVFMKNPENPLEPPVKLNAAEYFPPDPITGETILITRLRPQWNPTAQKEQITFKARASVSTGTENIRWSPVSQSSYEFTRDTNPEHIQAVFSGWLATNKKIADPTTLPEEQRAILMREFETMEIQRCYLKDDKGEANDFTFHIESIGVQAITDIVQMALVRCMDLVTKYTDLDTVMPETVRIQEGDSRFPSVEVIFTNEGHTLGNLLETYICENNIDGTMEPKASYVGYKVPHPLRPEMFVRLGLEDSANISTEVQSQTARLLVANACRNLKATFQQLLDAWAPKPAAQ